MKQKYTVVIIDDGLDIDGRDTQVPEGLLSEFQRFNEGKTPIPAHVTNWHDFEFDSVLIKDTSRLGELKWALKAIDVFVIDRKFVTGTHVSDRNQLILKPLRDLRVPGVKIVWTAYPDVDGRDKVQCMRLGAWDYLDKGSDRYDDIYVNVLVTAIEGLNDQNESLKRIAIDNAGVKFVSDNYKELYKKHAGQFIALVREPESENFTLVDSDSSLISLNVRIHEDANKKAKDMHITQIIK